MVRTTCISSQLMTELLTWRNPQGAEKGWFHSGQPQDISNHWTHVGKVVTTELSLMLLTVVAAVETVVYVPLAVLSALFSPVHKAPFNFFNDLARSSGFTIFRSLSAAAIDNVFFTNVLTQESFVRFYADQSQVFSVRFSDTRDDIYVNDWYLQHRRREVDNRFIAPDNPFLSSILAGGEEEQQVIRGANFIIQRIWPDLKPRARDKFKQMSHDMFHFVTTKAVLISLLENQRYDFFKIETQEGIEVLRNQGPIQGEILRSLQELLSSNKKFKAGTQDACVLPLFNKIRAIASYEIQGGLFALKCWRQVCNRFPQPELAGGI